MITLRRIYIETPLSTDELRARLDAAIGRTVMNIYDPGWLEEKKTPLAGKVDGMLFDARLRRQHQYVSVSGSIHGSTISAAAGITPLALAGAVLSIAFFTFMAWPVGILAAAIALFWGRRELARVEQALRDVVR